MTDIEAWRREVIEAHHAAHEHGDEYALLSAHGLVDLFNRQAPEDMRIEEAE